MIIQHNMTAMNANRNLGTTSKKLSKSTEKLSSGYKINRAGDNAAGLAISEKMRGQIRGLDQASTNAEDGISLIQTAEGALTETHSILQRMRELAVQASSDTNTDDDRKQIQNEIDQLTQEVDRIANTTEFYLNKDTAVAIGKFDGIHIGHQALLKRILDMKEKGMSKGEFTSVKQAVGGLDAMLDEKCKDKDLMALIKYIAEEDKEEKILENQKVLKTPIVRNAKKATIGYQPDVWKSWE